MQRTQIYLEEKLRDQIGVYAKQQNISMSEWIRRVLKQALKKNDTSVSVNDFFSQLEPLESFSEYEPENYVRNLRDQSRLLR
jgi:alpha-L-arabinofuranosidase